MLPSTSNSSVTTAPSAMPSKNKRGTKMINDLLLIVLIIAGVAAVIADICSADRALYNRMENDNER